MKTHGLLFSAPMATANVENRKTQTRRIMAGPGHWLQYHACITGGCPHTNESECDAALLSESRIQPGDTIYQKETFFHTEPWKEYPIFIQSPRFIYRADPDSFIGCHKWTPSIFMPRKATRFQAEVTQIRVQRIQDITDEDAIAEGLNHVGYSKLAKLRLWSVDPNADPNMHYTPESKTYDSARMCYSDLWNTINLPPAPVYGPKDKATRKRPILRYVSFPWSLDDFRKAYPKIENLISPTWRGLPLHIRNNPYVWAITYRRNS